MGQSRRHVAAVMKISCICFFLMNRAPLKKILFSGALFMEFAAKLLGEGKEPAEAEALCGLLKA